MVPKVLISTRFSFFGQSGWKSDFSTNPEMLFDVNRLNQRFWLFEKITLPSLKAQTNKDFHCFILSSNMMPEWAQVRLVENCDKYLGNENYTIRFARPGRARKFQRFALMNFAGEDPVAQVVLDDDDALSSDFVENLCTHLNSMDYSASDENLHFITFPKGYALGLRAESTRLWRHDYKFINLGLTMIGNSNLKNIFGISHRQAPKTFGFRTDGKKPMYIRTLSNVNDSHAIVRDKWSEMADWQSEKDVVERFPWLPEIQFEDYYSLPHALNTDLLQY